MRILLFLLSIFHLMNVDQLITYIQSCLHIFYIILSYAHLSLPFHSFVSSLEFHSIPKFVLEALSDSDWRSTMKRKWHLLSRMTHGVWYLFSRRQLAIVGFIEWNSIQNSSLISLKARLMAKRYSQMYDIDYQKTSSGVKLTSIFLNWFAASYHRTLHQLDIT